jgi:hypothetical protein
MTTKKTVYAVASSIMAASLMLAPAIVSAEDMVTETNQNTGNNSRNRNRTRIERRQREDHRQTATVVNTAGITADTGGNTSNENTDGGDQTSGKVKVDGMLTNTVNADPLIPTLPAFDKATVEVTNRGTGNNSRNTNRVSISDRYNVMTRKEATIVNTLTVNGMTGDNEMKKNTDGGSQDSGDVDVMWTVNNMAN